MKLSKEITGRVNVKLDVFDEKGNLVSSDTTTFGDLYPRALRVAGWLLLMAITALTMWFDPLMGCFVFPICRVATAGLNQLLTATLGGSTTWFVGLMGAAASDGVSNSSTTFTSASGSWAAGDVNRNILLMGVGAGGTDLLTTIAAVGSATSITLGAATSVTMTGVRFAFECRAADTMASHASFVEDTNYTQGTRPAWTPGAVSAGSVSNTASQAVFTMNATTYIFGAFLVNESTKGGATQTLFGAGVSSGGLVARTQSGFTINVTVTPSVTAT